MPPATVTTSIATHTSDDVVIRGQSLCNDLIGKTSFTEMIFFQILGHKPSPAQTAILDACLVTLVEHGLSPSAVTTRLVYTSAPEAMQAAIAAGLTAVGSLYVGAVEGCSTLLDTIVAADDPQASAEAIVAEHRATGEHVPGFGHPHFKPDDRRALRLFEIARAQDIAAAHVDAVQTLSTAIDQAAGKHITINATGAIAALLGDCGVPAQIMRGFAIISRCAGLVGHVHEEQQKPAMQAIWQAADSAVPYDGEKP